MLSAVIVAAGDGIRMHSPINKQFIEIKGKPVLLRTLENFCGMPEIDEIVVVLNKSDLNVFEEKIKSRLSKDCEVKVTYGGEMRYISVMNGLMAVNKDTDYILVHDGARPFVKKSEIKNVILKAKETGAALLGYHVIDTIKKIKDGVIVKTPNREFLYAVKTPKVFKADILRKAYSDENIKKLGFTPTDDSVVVESAGYEVSLVEGEQENIKITTPYDLIIADIIAEREDA